MSCLGTGEWLTLACVAFIVFSASRMGQLGNAVGRFMYNFRHASKGGRDAIDVTPTHSSQGATPESLDRR